MFTGLIEEQGRIQQIRKNQHTIKLTCEASEAFLSDYRVGDSMAINGVCLTAVEKNQRSFTVDIMPATFQRTTFSTSKQNQFVNLERAMKNNQRFEGHFVAGHVDGVTRLVNRREHENALVLVFAYPEKHHGEIIAQGSIALNGVSLTVTTVGANTFSVGLIPHSKEQTNLGNLSIGTLVNVETDMIGKYLKAQGNKFHSFVKEGLL